LPWKFYVLLNSRPPGYEAFEYFHPTFLYESLRDLAVFLALVVWLRPRARERPGTLFFSYLGLYSVGRGLIEMLRVDSFWLSGRVAQLASAAGMLTAAAGLVWIAQRGTRRTD
jgi:phosphatidylglycerol:prolipoprotein diacylglycerol transferase